MHIREYLPSVQFTLLVGSILFSGGLVLAAQAITSPETPKNPEVASNNAIYGAVENANWAETLRQIQSQNQDSALPQVPDEAFTQTLINSAQNNNITDSISRTLLINLSDAKFQGLGSDIPTQEKLVADATAKIEAERGAPMYTSANITLADTSKESWRIYGNAVMAVLQAHPKANFNDTLLAIGNAVDTQDAKKLASLKGIGAEYAAIAQDLSHIATPKTILPLHLSVVNDFARISQTYADMNALIQDPLRGLGGLEMYQSLVKETARVFTTIAAEFGKNGILFNTDEPGIFWSFFLSR